MANELASTQQAVPGKLGYSLVDTREGPDVGEVGANRKAAKGLFASSAVVLGAGTPAAIIHSDALIGSLAWFDAGAFGTLLSLMIVFGLALFVGGGFAVHSLVASKDEAPEGLVDELGEDVEKYSLALRYGGFSERYTTSYEIASAGKHRAIITDCNSNDNKHVLRITDQVDRFNLVVSRKIEQFTKDTVLWDDAVNGIMDTVKMEHPLTKEQESRVAAYKAGYSYSGIPGLVNRFMDKVAPVDPQTHDISSPPRWLKRKD